MAGNRIRILDPRGLTVQRAIEASWFGEKRPRVVGAV